MMHIGIFKLTQSLIISTMPTKHSNRASLRINCIFLWDSIIIICLYIHSRFAISHLIFILDTSIRLYRCFDLICFVFVMFLIPFFLLFFSFLFFFYGILAETIKLVISSTDLTGQRLLFCTL